LVTYASNLLQTSETTFEYEERAPERVL